MSHTPPRFLVYNSHSPFPAGPRVCALSNHLRRSCQLKNLQSVQNRPVHLLQNPLLNFHTDVACHDAVGNSHDESTGNVTEGWRLPGPAESTQRSRDSFRKDLDGTRLALTGPMKSPMERSSALLAQTDQNKCYKCPQYFVSTTESSKIECIDLF